MKPLENKILKTLFYFFTPEDSATPIQNRVACFNFNASHMGIGSAKALFWVMNSMILTYLISLLH